MHHLIISRPLVRNAPQQPAAPVSPQAVYSDIETAAGRVTASLRHRYMALQTMYNSMYEHVPGPQCILQCNPSESTRRTQRPAHKVQ